MSVRDRSERRSTPVTLRDVPLELRVRAAKEEARRARSEADRVALMAAAVWPSDQVFWVKGETAERAAA